MTENFPNLKKGKDIQVPEVQRVPNKWNQGDPHQDLKLSNIKVNTDYKVHLFTNYSEGES